VTRDFKFPEAPDSYTPNKHTTFVPWYEVKDGIVMQGEHIGKSKEGKIVEISLINRGELSISYYKDDMMHGPYTIFLNDGTYAEGHNRKGLPDGKIRTTFTDGSYEVREFIERDQTFKTLERSQKQ